MSASLKRTQWLAPAAVLLALAAMISARAEISLSERRSGYADLAPDTKAMQDDDTANPGMLWVLDGEALWNAKTGAANRACADCHRRCTPEHEGRRRALTPPDDAKLGRPVDLERADQPVPGGAPAGHAVRL